LWIIHSEVLNHATVYIYVFDYTIILFSFFCNFKTIKRFGPVVHEFLESNSLQYFINCIQQMYSTTKLYIYKSIYTKWNLPFSFLLLLYYIFSFFHRALSISGQKLFHTISLLDDFVDLIWTTLVSNFGNRNWKLNKTWYNLKFTLYGNTETIVCSDCLYVVL